MYLVEGYRVGDKVKQRTLKNLGILEELEKEEPGIYERLKREAAKGLLNETDEKEIVVKYDLEKEIGLDEKNYGWKVLNDIYSELGIKETIKEKSKSTRQRYDVNEVLKLLVLQRILNPQSKSATVQSKDTLFGTWEVNQNQMDRSLDLLNEWKSDIQLVMHRKVTETIGRTANLVFYDVTNYYFETDIGDLDEVDENEEVVEKGLRKRGASKEKRPKPIVQMGLFMDQNGIPISYQLFPGNQTDPVTYLPAIEQVKKQFGIERIVTVADKAMNSKKNVSAAFEKGDGWLFSQKIRGMRGAPKDIQEFVLERSGWEYNKNLTFAKKSMIRQRRLDNKQIVKEKVLVTWNQKYDAREKMRRTGALEYAEALRQPELFRMTSKKGGKKYLVQYVVDKKTGEIKELNPFIGIDYALIEFDAQFDGINVLVTSEVEMTDEEMLENYRQLYKIEDCFRVTKTDLEARPVYVWTKEHIEAHFLTCFISLTLLRILQYRTVWQMSVERMVKALKSATTSELEQGYWRVQGNEDFIELNKLLGIEWSKSFVKYEQLKNYANGWFTTKKP